MAVTTATLSQDIFTALRTLIIANKPTYTYGGTTYTYDLEAEYPRDNPTFPIIVLNESSVNVSLINLDGSGEDYKVEVQLDFYAKELHGKKAIDAGRDGLRATFLNNITNFKDNNGLNPMEDFWEDSNTDVFQDRNQVINIGSSKVKFKLK